MERIVDLRSDTQTQPTDQMRQAMARAVVGDDVYGEDPTIQRLQELAAAKVGHEAALFMPTGTMANTAALMAHTHPGEEVIFEELAHLFNWEAGTYANVAGLSARTVRGEDGIYTADQLRSVLRPSNPHFPPTTLACIENTHNNHAGSVWTAAETQAVCDAAHEEGIKVHLDGARVFNAAIALKVDVKELTKPVDSLMFCFSKGLSAPVGSILCGSREFIDRAYRMRKRLGGAMRQVGVLGAAAIVALETMVERLAEDHETARLLEEGLNAFDGIQAHRASRPTNILMVDVGGAGWTTEQLIERWSAAGIRCNPRPPTSVRLVTNRHFTPEDVTYVLDVTRDMVDGKAVAAGGG
ncbi:MAG: aminotransferase class I/II-fold pyridoxal phosphate-dependent enzyme [Gemmatimonadetes bacterium]|mgnify:FL=1|jgi:threonine aldolase|nr:aminotransferase class I/II-fold pyridoxal phosphate-dependent enzyme [Gemmatimonadota bacterium]MBT5146179.1 aminotransferase class I/II-fold pyridoxal phosphate-dependent enzyme [Gemmatimonadota bacterium]MBT5590822.1 aminotransferase class I/II-fold pyridoxal phosphate-dependent enzyme [Gemmatimonadota bacterium]MBT5961290.1 aminotransferase class I/II-fold pyridoxal phosphate-dependent enzyme [Gemmatimonadota bacterium]MBT6625903.1 aminotransferase class I/II-fold pyridoxal phosphate-dep